MKYAEQTESGLPAHQTASHNNPGYSPSKLFTRTMLDAVVEKARAGYSYNQLLQGLPAALYTCDTQGIITMYNRAAADLWGREPEIGKDYWCGSWKIFKTDGTPIPHEECPMAIALKEARPVLGEEIMVERPDGLRRIVAPHPQPLFSNQGKLAGAVNMLVDITDIRQANYELAEKNKELERFAYAASHDLIEPLNTISNFINLLELEEKPSFSDQGKEYMGYVKESANRLSELITDMLEHSRIGRQSKWQMVDFNQIISEVLVSMKPALDASGAKINVQPMPVLPAFPKEIRLLFQNLISNAIKFKAPGVVPEVKIFSNYTGKGWQFTVEDNGVGIEEKFWERIFIIFQRLHTNREYPGTGIGLAHCKKIVELHGGKMWLESAVGKGSKFHFTLSR